MFKQSLKPFVAEFDLSKEELLAKVCDYLDSKKLTYQIDQSDEGIIVTTTYKPTFWQLLANKHLLKTVWTIMPFTSTQSELKILPHYPQGFWGKAWLIILILFSCWVLACLIGGKMCPLPLTVIEAIVWIGLFGLLLISLSRYALALFNISTRMDAFKQEFYSLFTMTSKICIRDGGFSFPYRKFVISILMVLVVLSLTLCWAFPISGWNLRNPYIISLTLVVLIGFLIGLISLVFLLSGSKEKFGAKFSIGLLGATIGGNMVIAYNIPLFLSCIHRDVNDINWYTVDWHSIDIMLRSISATYRLFSLVFIMFIILMFSVPIYLTKRILPQMEPFINELIILKHAPKSSIYEQSLQSPVRYSFRFIVWFFWILCFIGMLTAFYSSFSILSVISLGIYSPSFMNISANFVHFIDALLILLLGGYLPCKIIILINHFSLSAYAGTFLLLCGYILWNRYQIKREMQKDIKYGRCADYNSIVKTMAEKTGVKMPVIALKDTNAVGAKSGPGYILIYWGTVSKFKDKPEMIALLAHEMHHLKVGSGFRYKLYNILSQIALMGKSFLLILFDFYKWEYESDEFAVNWLVENHNYSLEQAKKFMIRVLETIKEFPAEEKLAETKLERFTDLYFKGKPETYFHPSINQRINAIQNVGLFPTFKPL